MGATPTAVGQSHETFFATHPDMVDLARRNHVYRLGAVPVHAAGVEHGECYDEALEAARQRNARILGELTLAQAGVAKPETTGRQSLLDRLRLAASGDMQARQGIFTDASTEIIEQTLKSGAVIEVEAEYSNGEIKQFGQTTYHRQKNTLEYYPDLSGGLRSNTIAEGQNGLFAESLIQRGELRGKKMLEWSLVLDNETRANLADYGYYLNEMIAIIRLTEVQPSGKVKITSALVGGVDQDELPRLNPQASEADEAARQDQALATRFDIATVRRIYELFGYENAYKLSTTELLATPLIVPEEYDVLDFVQLYDAVASDLLGKDVFFGLTDLKRQYAGARAAMKDHYKLHAHKSRERQAATNVVAEAVVTELLQRSPEPQTALEASQLLRRIAKNHAVQYVVRDLTADARVFGHEAYELIMYARQLHAQGDHLGAMQVTDEARRKAKDTGCPTANRQAADKNGVSSGDNSKQESKKSADDSNEKAKWKWKKGVCRVTNCPTRPKTTKVGPCSVCYGCQRKFDNGQDPTTEYARKQKATQDTKPSVKQADKKSTYDLAA